MSGTQAVNALLQGRSVLEGAFSELHDVVEGKKEFEAVDAGLLEALDLFSKEDIGDSEILLWIGDDLIKTAMRLRDLGASDVASQVIRFLEKHATVFADAEWFQDALQAFGR